MNELVTVITATMGRKSLARCIESVKKQTYKDVQHLIVADGPKSAFAVKDQIVDAQIKAAKEKQLCNVDLINLPYSVGKDHYNGHKIYGACTYLAKGEYIMYLDDDNWIDPEHIQDCLNAIHKSFSSKKILWSFSLRKIVNNNNGDFLCNDDCESLGNYPTVIAQNDYLVDVNCYFFQKELAIQLTPIWNRKARDPNMMEVDRVLIQTLLNNQIHGACTGHYTVNYAVGGNQLSVQPEFFEKGNDIMKQKYNGVFPWRK